MTLEDLCLKRFLYLCKIVDKPDLLLYIAITKLDAAEAAIFNFPNKFSVYTLVCYQKSL